MATADELLSTIDTDKTLIIDKDLRTIIIPSSVKNLGVESDDDVLRLKFSMPRMYGDVDLSDFSIYINYMNAKNTGDVYVVDDKTIADDTITFSWLVGRVALAYKGSVRFIVCMKKHDDDSNVIQEYNTTIASLPVLEGLETGETVIQQNPDIIEMLLTSSEPLVGTTQTVTPSQVLATIKVGRDIALQYTDSYYGTFVFSAFNANEKLGIVVSNSILPQMNGLTGTLLGFVEDDTWLFKATNTATKDDVGTAVNEALAAAKASGEFDGADGITPTIGDNGNWYLGDTDTNKPSRGANGKSAYSYAQDGGYTGTEEEFAAKLAEETGTVPENVALLEDVTVDEASGDFIPMLSKNGTEYRLSIGDDGVPVIKNANGETVWSGTSGGSSGGDTGGDDPGSDTPTGEWESGAEVAYNLVEGEWANADGSFVPYDGWSRTDFIYCYGAGHIYHSCSGSSSINIVFYGIDKKFVSSHNGYDAWTAIPENAAYVVISHTTEEMTGSVIKLYKKVEPTWTDGKPYKFMFIENEYINTGNGQPTAYNGWKRTDYVNCVGVTKITKTNASADSQYGAFYNAEKEHITGMKIPNTTGGTSADITVPVGACYFITSDSNANMDALVLIPYA